MLVFFDTEFTDFAEDAKLISIGLVTETGDAFYAELSDTYTIEDCSEFVIERVLPLLEGGSTRMTFKELQSQLYEWLKSLGEPITLATDSVAWDGYWLREIFNGNRISPTANVLTSITNHTPNGQRKITSNCHHALLDAQLLFNNCITAMETI